MAFGEIMVLKFLILYGIFSVTVGQEPCSQMDPGEWKPVRPVLYITVYEASEEDLLLYPNDEMYQGELRIHGSMEDNSPNAIILEPQQDFIMANPAEIFKLESVSGRNIIRLIQPLDRDGPTESIADDITVITFTMKCSPTSNSSVQILYDVSVLIQDKNDNPPMIIGAPYETTINELTPIGSPVLTITAVDKDSNLDGNITYTVVRNTGLLNDGSGVFDINPFDGHITVKGSLDYESLGDGHKYYIVRVLVTDGGPNNKLSAHTDVKISITDGNDNRPFYFYGGCVQHRMYCVWPKYTSDVNAVVLNEELRFRGVPDISGNDIQIRSKDADGVPSDLQFSIASTIPVGYDSFFSVETKKRGVFFEAIIKQIKTYDHSVKTEIYLKAEELSLERHFEIAMIEFVGQKSSGSGNIEQTTTQALAGITAPQNDNKVSKSETTDGFSQTTVALIVVITITLTLVICLAVAMSCTLKRRRMDNYKTPLTSVTASHDIKESSVNNEVFSATL